MTRVMTPEQAERVSAAIKELWAVAEESGLTVLCNDDESDDDDRTPQVVLTLEGRWPDEPSEPEPFDMSGSTPGAER